MLLDISILPQTSEELFYFVTKRIPYLCGFWRFANAIYEYDEEEEYYTCGVNLDEDEMYRFLAGNCGDCPYFSQDDEYRVVRHQM